MRHELGKRVGQRKKFRATFSKSGKKTNYKGYSEPTILLTHIMDCETNTRITDHVWFSYTQSFENTGMKPGETVEFEARIKEYKKGYVNKRNKINEKTLDFKLSHPTKIKVIK